MPKKNLISIETAIKKIIKQISLTSIEEVNILDTFGRINAKNIFSKVNNPSNDVSSMDGYAIDGEDIKESYSVIGESAAGTPYKSRVKTGHTVQIFTGAHLPKGTNTIIIQENVQYRNNKIYLNDKNIIKFQYVRRKGLDFKKKQIILKKNLLINARRLNTIAMSGNHLIKVRKKPVIGILSTGNEIKKIGASFKNYEIPSGNNLMLSSIVKIFGGTPKILPIARDKKDAIKNIIDRNLNCDLIVTSGGASVGKYDLLSDLFRQNTKNSEIEFWRIAMRPGKPLMFGKYKKLNILGLPGNPVSAGVCALVFLRAAIRKMLGLKNYFPKIYTGISETLLEENDERMDFIRSVYQKKNIVYVTPFLKQDSSMTNTFSKSNCLLIRKPFDKKIVPGDEVKFIKFPSLF